MGPRSRHELAASASADGRPSREDHPHLRWRLNLLGLLFAAVMIAFGMRIYKLTILDGPRHRRESEENFLREESIAAPRGRILDRNGWPLAINRTVFDVTMSPLRLTRDEIDVTVARVAALTGRPRVVQQSSAVVMKRPRENSVTLVGGLTLAEVLPVLEQRFELPGVMVRTGYQRVYPEREVTGQLTGHVGGITRSEMESHLEAGYLRGELIGRMGAERAFEPMLRGTPGTEMLWRDHVGRTRQRTVHTPAVPGASVRLTLDLGMQRLADALLEGQRGVIIALDPRDGSVLAMATRPGYDPNRPTAGSQFNKAYQGGRFSPGSTFKVMTAASGLLAGHTPSEGVFCGGLITIGGHRFPCHQRWGHDWENLSDALTHSCNVYFYTWARAMKAEQQLATAAAFGFGRPTGLDLAIGIEAPGHLAQVGRDTIYPGNLLHMAIGQGELISVTPLQMAQAYAALCNGGTLFRPRILQDLRTAEGVRVEEGMLAGGERVRPGMPIVQGRLPLSPEQRETILAGLWRVTHDLSGTGRHGGFKPEWRVAGKTGTAQMPGQRQSDAWFACYAPAEAPEIVLVVLVQDAGHGGEVAGPLARQLLAYHFGEPEELVQPPPNTALVTASAGD